MAVLTLAQIKLLMLDRAQANVATDAPATVAEQERFINEAYADLWEISGGSVKRVASATAWTSASTATGIVAGILTDIAEVISLFQTTVSGSTGSETDTELDQVELGYIKHVRGAFGYSNYSVPKLFALTRTATLTPADVGKLRLDYWPSVTGFFFPVHYRPQFTILDDTVVTTPDVNDLESRDIGLLAAAKLAPLIGRAELVPSILADVSQRTSEMLERKLRSLVSADQDR